MVSVAFKEWAAVCRALALGHQSLILRKGGIAEIGGQFTPEFDRFWLYPTHFHEQQQAGLKPEWLHLLEDVHQPKTDQLEFTHWAEVEKVEYLTDWQQLLDLNPLHVWNESTVRQRFEYRKPGLYVLRVKVHQAEQPMLMANRPEYAGCKTWVQLLPE